MKPCRARALQDTIGLSRPTCALPVLLHRQVRRGEGHPVAPRGETRRMTGSAGRAGRFNVNSSRAVNIIICKPREGFGEGRAPDSSPSGDPADYGKCFSTHPFFSSGSEARAKRLLDVRKDFIFSNSFFASFFLCWSAPRRGGLREVL